MKNKELKSFRKAKGLSQSEFASMLGVSQPTISSAEKKPELLVSNNLHNRFREKFSMTDQTTTDDSDVEFAIQVRFKKSDLHKVKDKHAIVDISNFFQPL